MSATFDDFPARLIAADPTSRSVHVQLDASLYPLEAVYGAAYIFIDRCFVLLDRPDASHIRVTLTVKQGEGGEAWARSAAGEFVNELLGCTWRAQITQQNRPIIEALTTQALAGAMGAPSLDELATFDFTEESFEDPLGIAMSWEDKYKKKDKAEAAPAASEPDPHKGGT